MCIRDRQYPVAGNGMDWWRMSRVVPLFHSYNTANMCQARRSFSPWQCEEPWFAGYWPGDHSRQYELQARLEAIDPEDASREAIATELKSERARLLEESTLGQIGHAIEPAVAPLGWDWKIGVGAVASFPAREVIIATLGTIYSLGGEEDEEGLIGAIRSSKYPDGTPVYNIPVALSIMVFFALCAQCMSTLLVIQRETNSWFWPALSFTYMTVLAYLGALVTYQVGTRFF